MLVLQNKLNAGNIHVALLELFVILKKALAEKDDEEASEREPAEGSGGGEFAREFKSAPFAVRPSKLNKLLCVAFNAYLHSRLLSCVICTQSSEVVLLLCTAWYALT